jgi:hypothetical protein
MLLTLDQWKTLNEMAAFTLKNQKIIIDDKTVYAIDMKFENYGTKGSRMSKVNLNQGSPFAAILPDNSWLNYLPNRGGFIREEPLEDVHLFNNFKKWYDEAWIMFTDGSEKQPRLGDLERAGLTKKVI